MELDFLVVPEANADEEAGKMIRDLPSLWDKANLEERRMLLNSMLDAVYVDVKKTKSIIALKPKSPFKPVLSRSIRSISKKTLFIDVGSAVV